MTHKEFCRKTLLLSGEIEEIRKRAQSEVDAKLSEIDALASAYKSQSREEKREKDA